MDTDQKTEIRRIIEASMEVQGIDNYGALAKMCKLDKAYLSRVLAGKAGKSGFSKTAFRKISTALGIPYENFSRIMADGSSISSDKPEEIQIHFTLEESFANQTIYSVLEAYFQLSMASISQAVEATTLYGKNDCLGMDAIGENVISQTLHNFDVNSVLITEESSDSLSSKFSKNYGDQLPPTIYIADPIDRSSQLREFLETSTDRSKTVGDFLTRESTIDEWEKHFGDPASITGASIALSCVRRGAPICSAIVNIISQELFVACRSGVFRFALPHYRKLQPSLIHLGNVVHCGETLKFRSFEDTQQNFEGARHFVTFTGSSEKQGYGENLIESGLLTKKEIDEYLAYDRPGGPLRILYLTSIQPVNKSIGLIISNGEKIGEWVHWLPFFRYGKPGGVTQSPLCLFEIYYERPLVKDGTLMATPPMYSIFRADPDRLASINFDRIKEFEHPRLIRSMLLVMPPSNYWAITKARNCHSRELVFPRD